MSTVLITGANRGLGLELVRQYTEDGWTVYAGCRDLKKADALHKLIEVVGDKLKIVRLDINSEDQVNAVVEQIGDTTLDLLINNAAIVDQEGYGSGAYEGHDDPDLRKYDYGQWCDILTTNVLGPARVTGAFVDHLARSDRAVVVMMVSGLASITNTWQAGRYAYRTSKAALNMLMRSIGEWFEPKGISIVSISPGWMQTDMGGPHAQNSVEQSATGVRQVIAGLKIKDTGAFLNFDGTTLPW